MKIVQILTALLLIPFFSFSQLGNLIWEDNFNNNELDTLKWSYETGTGVNGDWGTGQIDRATDRIENVSFQSGISGAEDACLVITTQEEFYIDRNYTSGRINTAGKASWGPGHRIVSKVYPRDVKHPGQGFAFWMMPDEIPVGWSYIMWPQGGEIDIMEYVGAIPFHNLGGVHYAWSWENNQWQSWNHGHQSAYYSFETEEVPDPSDPGYGGYPASTVDPNAGSSGFHTYGIDWYSDRMEFFIDSSVYHVHFLNDGAAFNVDGQDEFIIADTSGHRVGYSEFSNHFPEWHPFEHKMYAILSAGVGGSSNTYGGAVVPEANFPCSVFIDWVRVYELGLSGLSEPTNDHGFQIYPNPTNDLLTIKLNDSNEHRVNITDVNGKVVLNTSVIGSSILDISKLDAGKYIVVVRNDKISSSKELIVR